MISLSFNPWLAQRQSVAPVGSRDRLFDAGLLMTSREVRVAGVSRILNSGSEKGSAPALSRWGALLQDCRVFWGISY